MKNWADLKYTEHSEWSFFTPSPILKVDRQILIYVHIIFLCGVCSEGNTVKLFP